MWSRPRRRVLPGFGLSLGFTLFYVCLLVLIPLAGLTLKAQSVTWPAFVAAVTLLSAYIHARRVTPREKAMVDSLKEKARTDAEVQKVLQPELDRQHQVLVLRRKIYGGGGVALLLSSGMFLAWLKWFRPGKGEWAGLPGRVLKYFEPASDRAAGSARAGPPPDASESPPRPSSGCPGTLHPGSSPIPGESPDPAPAGSRCRA